MLTLCLLLSTCLCDPVTDLRDAIEVEDIELIDEYEIEDDQFGF
jgi:hypothetical protein